MSNQAAQQARADYNAAHSAAVDRVKAYINRVDERLASIANTLSQVEA